MKTPPSPSASPLVSSAALAARESALAAAMSAAADSGAALDRLDPEGTIRPSGELRSAQIRDAAARVAVRFAARRFRRGEGAALALDAFAVARRIAAGTEPAPVWAARSAAECGTGPAWEVLRAALHSVGPGTYAGRWIYRRLSAAS